MPHLSELHGAATHLAVIAIPVYAVVLMLRRFGPDHQTLRHVEPWLLGAALAGVLLAGVTGLLVWGQSKTMLRGSHYDIGGIHFWLGIALARRGGRRVRHARHGRSAAAARRTPRSCSRRARSRSSRCSCRATSAGG